MQPIQSVLRETVAERLLQTPRMNPTPAGIDFQAEVVEWLEKTEETLKRLRHPLAGMVAAKCSLAIAATDGYRPGNISDNASRRQAARSTCALIVDEVTTELIAITSQVDHFFAEMADRMAQLLAVATAEAPIPLPPTEPRSAWLEKVWSTLAQNAATGSMHAYLGARLSRTDRHYLLDELIGHLE